MGRFSVKKIRKLFIKLNNKLALNQNACIVGESKVFFIQFKNCVNSFLDDPAF